MDSWYIKHKPTKLDDMLINREDMKKMKKWISDFKNNKPNTPKSLLLYGPPGVGKTTIATLLFNEYDYDIREFNASEIRNQKLIRENILNINGSINVSDILCYKKKYIGIIMDEIDGMSCGDRGGLTELCNIIYKNKAHSRSPFICITNTLEKKMKTIKDKSCTIPLVLPNKFQLNELVKRILKAENIKCNNLIMVKYIVDRSQNDFRRLLNICEYIFTDSSININILTLEETKKYIDNFDKKKVDITPYKCVDKLLSFYKDLNYIYELFEYDKNLVTLLFYENFSSYITKYINDSQSNKLNNIAKIYNLISEYEYFDNEIYTKQHFVLNQYNCIIKLAIPSYLINNMKRKSISSVGEVFKVNYSNIINKTSLEYLNYKMVDIINRKITNYSDSEIVFNIIDIIITILFIDIDNGVEILKYYNITFDEFDKIIKHTSVDYKNKYTNKCKQYIKKKLL
jgi:replication factor C subunit 1